MCAIVSKLTGITANSLRNEKPLSEVLPHFLRWIKSTTENVSDNTDTVHYPGKQILYKIYVSGSSKRDLMAQIKKIEFFTLIKRYNLSQLIAKILEGKTFDTQRNWQLNWALFSKAIELEIEKT